MDLDFFNKFGFIVVIAGAYLLSGTIKFLVNSLRAGKLAYGTVGLGGMPSTHTSVVSSALALAFLRDGVSSTAFGISLALLFIVVIDAINLRRHIGEHATFMNKINKQLDLRHKPLREKMGHNPLEILAGFFVGVAVAFTVNSISG